MKRSERGMPEGNATYINQNQNHRSNHNQLNNNLYLKNLEENVTDDDLKELFSAFGTVMSAKVNFLSLETARPVTISKKI